jgi:hypothetical protein
MLHVAETAGTKSGDSFPHIGHELDKHPRPDEATARFGLLRQRIEALAGRTLPANVRSRASRE